MCVLAFSVRVRVCFRVRVRVCVCAREPACALEKGRKGGNTSP